MQIQQSLQNIAGTAQVIPPQVLAGMVVGQQIEAAVVQASLAAQLVSLKIGESLIQVTTPVPLKQGQTVQLELVQGGEKPVLKLIPPSDVVQSSPRVNPSQVSLVQGQQVAVEVIKLLAENRLLVQTTDPRLLSPSGQPKPVQFDIDISRLVKSFSIGEKVLIEVVTVKPLSVALKAAPAVREQVVIDKIKQLLPQLEAKPQLANLTSALKTLSLPSSVQGPIQQLVSHIIDKQGINQPQALKQAIASSGVFTERQLLKPNIALNSDFKANLLKVAAVIVGELTGKPVAANTVPTVNNLAGGLKPFSSLSTGSLGQSQVGVSAGAVSNQLPTTSSSSLLAGSLGKSQASIPAGALPNQLSTKAPSSLSTGSLGQSRVIVPSEPVPNSKQLSSVVNPAVTGSGIEVKRNPLSSPFAFQNQTKAPVSSTSVKAESAALKAGVTNTAQQAATVGSVSDRHPKLTLLSAILRAVGSYNATQNSVSVLNASPSAASLPSALPAFLESVLTAQQATALAQALNKSISAEQLRARGRFDVVFLQGLLKEVESLHARVQLNQFSMLKEPDSPASPMTSWLIDLPVKDKQGIDFIQLQIDQFKNQNEDEDNEIWNVQLRLDTQNLGPLQATVTMHVDDIKIVLRAERPESAALLEGHIGWLHDALTRLGVSVSHVSCSCGPVAKPTLAEQYLAETTSLVDLSV
jgi:hypothetical protein